MFFSCGLDIFPKSWYTTHRSLDDFVLSTR
nr:MAG TPA: hypothetical protein [Caudoviricetes sp.]